MPSKRRESNIEKYFVNVTKADAEVERNKKKNQKSWDMKSPAKYLNHHELISGLLIVALVLVNSVNGNSDHCKARRFASAFNTSYMQFTKEIVNQEYAIEGEFKNLHCCAKGYRSIEWWVSLSTCRFSLEKKTVKNQ